VCHEKKDPWTGGRELCRSHGARDSGLGLWRGDEDSWWKISKKEKCGTRIGDGVDVMLEQ